MSAKSSPRSFRRNISLSFDNHFNYLGNDPIPSLFLGKHFSGENWRIGEREREREIERQRDRETERQRDRETERERDRERERGRETERERERHR